MVPDAHARDLGCVIRDYAYAGKACGGRDYMAVNGVCVSRGLVLLGWMFGGSDGAKSGHGVLHFSRFRAPR